MEQLLKPERFDVDPTCIGAESKWKHWKRTFSNFLTQMKEVTEEKKLQLLCNFVSASVYQYINDSESYNKAIVVLDSLYISKRNEIFARHCLASRQQQTGESVNEYLQILKQMSKDCEFKSVTSDEYKNEYIRDAFIRGLKNPRIRERLLENVTISLDNAFDQARALELAEHHSASYLSHDSSPVAAVEEFSEKINNDETKQQPVVAPIRSGKCFFCGGNLHMRKFCPAKDAVCRACGKKGHYEKVCNSKSIRNVTNRNASMTLASVPIVPRCLEKSITKVLVNGVRLNALVDTGSSLSFINERFIKRCRIRIKPYFGKITMANSSLSSDVTGCCSLTIKLQNHVYTNVEILVMKNLCTDFLIGHDLLKDHSSVEIDFKGDKPPLRICSLATAQVTPVSLFSNLTPDCRPIATKSRRRTEEDKKFIAAEVRKLLEEGVIEPSNSPWRAQAFVVKGGLHRPRMVIDYSQTINRFTMLDAYPLPKIEDLISKVSKYAIFSTIDLRSAYHQIPIKESEKHFTAFEADGKLYQFLRVPFGVTNGVAAFQRTIDEIISKENLSGTFPYLDDVTICGKDQNEHDNNLKQFMAAVKKYNLTLNKEKCTFSTKSVRLLGYSITNHIIKPDPDRLKPLMDLPIPKDTASLQRALGMFAHYCRWIPRFSEKIRPLLTKGPFPLTKDAENSFNSLKKDIANASLAAIEDKIPFRVETDASEYAIGATLSQAGRPIAFFSRTLNSSERKHSSIEKEAYAIVESLRNWRHYLIGRHFEVFTDQRSVAFMFDQQHSSKIKNEKIMRWRLELACFKFDIIYRPGNKNETADTLSRISAAIKPEINLNTLHNELCHPGITRMYHWIRSKNMPFSIEEVRRVVNSCSCCNEIKPRFYRSEGHLIKATAPFERLNLDFKGPLPSVSKNRFLLTIVDEFSRFPFAMPCPDISSATVVTRLQNIFSIFGMPAYIHSDRGSAFMSRDLKSFLTSLGIATSRTTPYNPQGNGQVERYNGIIWKTVQLALKSKNIAIERWEEVLQPALHSIRSLLCTATNATPHERMFIHARRSYNGCSLPTWLTQPGPVLMKNHARINKYQPIVQEVELIEANPDYAHVKLPDGRETTVSVRHLAPRGEPVRHSDDEDKNDEIMQRSDSFTHHDEDLITDVPDSVAEEVSTQDDTMQCPQRPKRQRQKPSYLEDYVMD